LYINYKIVYMLKKFSQNFLLSIYKLYPNYCRNILHICYNLRQHFLYLIPEPHGQGSFLPTFSGVDLNIS